MGKLILKSKHRLLCGDCTKQPDADRLTMGRPVDAILTDPPYCSGGFQEAGRSAGSVGTDADHVPIANDRLSTRGYAALLKSAFGNIQSTYLYCFTDWRMLVHLFDISESLGFCVRSMIVWDKGTPGMGRGWRCQHELILWACKATPPFDKHAPGVGNVIQTDRTGNEHHTTEKPVELARKLMTASPFIRTVCDCFAGSGTTIIAAQSAGLSALACELDPRYVDTAIARWHGVSKLPVVLDGTGETFEQTKERRRG